MPCKRLIRTLSCLVILALPVVSSAEPQEAVARDERCPVCGMFVARHADWMSQVRQADGTVRFFDGMKDLFVYFFDPEAHGGSPATAITEVWAKDYYTLQWFDARRAFLVVGGDVYGPMGHELVPFSSRRAAEVFLKDHHGKDVLTFDAVTDALVQSLRLGQKMR